MREIFTLDIAASNVLVLIAVIDLDNVVCGVCGG